MFWMSSKSNVISGTLPFSSFAPNISGSYRSQMLVSPSLNALVYLLCILCISLETPSSIKLGRNGYHTQNLPVNPVSLVCHQPQQPDGAPSQCGAKKSLVVC
jgi:hypothetical protein